MHNAKDETTVATYLLSCGIVDAFDEKIVAIAASLGQEAVVGMQSAVKHFTALHFDEIPHVDVEVRENACGQ